jgi:Transposase DNA-binding/Transposase Tn5 dimerisation domain
VASWVVRELIGAELGDTRLNDRLIRIVEAIAQQPEAGIPQACGKAGAKAAYRFFDNPRVEAGKILATHAQSAAKRAAVHQVVLAPQDTTTWSLGHHPATEGLGPVSNVKKSQGLLVHSTMLLDPKGTPLGVLDQQVWARSAKNFGSRKKARQKEVHEKESQCWLNSLAAVQQALPEHPQVVVIGDRESDLFDLFVAPRRPGVDLLVRVGREGRCVDHEAKYLKQAVAQSPVRGTLSIEVPRTNDRPARQAEVQVRWASLTVMPSRHHPQRKQLSPLRLQFILIEEKNPPSGQKPLYWLLVTTLPVDTLEDALRCVIWYTYRWRIERLHFVFKSGCKIEHLQLETAERLMRALACYTIVAWQLLWLTYEARQNPEQSCARILSRHEWQSLHAAVHPKQPIPDQPPTMREAVRMIAQLGGFLARKHDGEPGVKTLWRGLRRLHDISRGWQRAKSHQPRAPTVLLVGNG